MKPLVLAAIILLQPSVDAQQTAAAPPVLEKGLGTLHHPVTTHSAEAQQFFDQGLKFVYAFNHEEAVRSFTRAGELDPNLAMAWWGVALALGPNINMDVDPAREKQAFDAIQQAKVRESQASPKERDAIEALAVRYSDDPKADLKQKGVDYSHAMAALSKRYPDDPDYATLYAESLMDLRPWKFWSSDGKPAEGTLEIVRVLKGVLSRWPNHLGANHYLIHAVEASPHPEEALVAAQKFKTLAPDAGHLVHMPAHIYQRTGNYAGAAAANEKAAETDRRFIKKSGGRNMYSAMYYNHNLQFGSASYMMIGRFAEARRMADELSSNAAAAASEMPPFEEAVPEAQLVLVRFGHWPDVLKMPVATAGPFSTTMSHFARGVAFARLGNVSGARVEQRAFEKARATLPDDTGIMQNKLGDVATVAAHALEGRIAEAEGNQEKAIEAFRQAVAAEDALSYDEPADWFYPTRETLGGLLLQAGRPAEAEQVFREDLQRNRHNPRSLFGLAEALRAQKKKGASARMAEFHQRWRGGALRVADL